MFGPAKKLPQSDFRMSKHTGKKYDSRVQKTAQNYRSWNTMGADGTGVMEDESGVSTPPLWGTNPSTIGNNINYRCLSPSSQAQAIARGQMELMEMVSRMPESCFELTLKDLVEHRDPAVEPKQESCAVGRGAINGDTYIKDKGKKKNQKPRINRIGSIDNGGFLLKMVFPFSSGSKSKNKRNGSNVNYNFRVSPKPTVSDEYGKSIDKEWWKKRSGSSESDSGGSNVTSGSTKSSRSSSNTGGRRKGKCCLSFIFNRKIKA
ncbi:putative Tetratricopeptide repeat (TPR)-like superfamily protein [Hibiscus syriacus]|uniref:Tetratricopeptide repeat (TPR)-like superfamily protein n=2 Tax=Hibiscus syriacus TaxID=106335 RepID=A0A6A2XR46_HIBSY|nr:putative Tetratricopeptide repeat (TPR)-like superfamily protein [Hibiscus syriacus]